MTSNSARLGVVVVAAGQSSRMGGIDKQVAVLGGEAVISHSLRVLDSYGDVGSIVLVMSAENLAEGKAAVEAGGFAKIVGVVAGGERRQDSVKIGLDLLGVEKQYLIN